MPDVITRFAPSPTGHLHIGGARTALFCWAYAKGHKGHFALRIEDTDQARSSEASARGILEDLAWLGIEWDEGPAFEYTDERGRTRTIGGDPRGVGSFYQSKRIDSYNGYLMRLVEQGRAYPAFETGPELEAKRRLAVSKKQTYRYDRAALEIPLAERLVRMRRADDEKTPYVVRFLMPDAPVLVTDEVLGEVKYAAGEVDDFVIRKADGFPTYHFAVVCDDQEMGVTHVLRGQEHLNNTPKHVALQAALGFRVPQYAHMPLIFNMDGTKMSKRDKDKAVREAVKRAGMKDLSGLPADAQARARAAVSDAQFLDWLGDAQRQLPTDVLELVAAHLKVTLPEIEVHDFRKAGYLPETICNFIALLGWSPGENVEKFNNDFLATRFDLPRIGKTNAKFDRVKLLSFNTDTVTAMSEEIFLDRWRAWLRVFNSGLLDHLSEPAFVTLAAAVRERSKTFRDAMDQARFVLTEDGEVAYDEKAVAKTLRGGKEGEPSGLDVLRSIRAVVAALTHFEKAELHDAIETYALAQNLGMGKVAQPLRVALTGTTVSPPIDATLAVLGRHRALTRIDRCLTVHA